MSPSKHFQMSLAGEHDIFLDASEIPEMEMVPVFKFREAILNSAFLW